MRLRLCGKELGTDKSVEFECTYSAAQTLAGLTIAVGQAIVDCPSPGAGLALTPAALGLAGAIVSHDAALFRPTSRVLNLPQHEPLAAIALYAPITCALELMPDFQNSRSLSSQEGFDCFVCSLFEIMSSQIAQTQSLLRLRLDPLVAVLTDSLTSEAVMDHAAVAHRTFEALIEKAKDRALVFETCRRATAKMH